MASSDGVTITFHMTLKPEAVEMFVQAAPTLLEGTTTFPGFRSIRIVQHKDDPTKVLFVERWESEEAYRKYIAWRTEQGAMDGMAQMVTAMETHVWPNVLVEA
jgi:quinol monooxygenase YgiN